MRPPLWLPSLATTFSCCVSEDVFTFFLISLIRLSVTWPVLLWNFRHLLIVIGKQLILSPENLSRLEAGNSLNLAVTAVVGQHSLLLFEVMDFAMLPAQRFWRETASLLEVMWPRSNQWERALKGTNFQL